LLVWQQSVGLFTTLLATRVGPDGALLDAPSLRLGQTRAGTVEFKAATLGSDFVIAWQIQNDADATANGTRISRIRGSDGALLDRDAPLIPDDGSSLVDVKGAGDITAVLLGHATGWTVERIQRGVRLSSTVSIPLSFGLPSLFAGKDQFLVARYPNAFRVDAVTGARLDAAAVVFSRFEMGWDESQLTGFFADGAYALIWQGSKGDLRVARMRASDGTLLDPFDSFNEIPGSRQIVAQSTSKPVKWLAASPLATGTGAVLAWSYSLGGEIAQVRVDVAGNRADAAATIPVLLGWAGGTPMALASSGGFLGSVRLTFDSKALPVVGDAVTVASCNNPQNAPLVASNGTDFLAVWAEPWAEGKGLNPSNGFASRIDGRTGRYLDSPPIQLGHLGGETPRMAVASDGSGYLVAWAENVTASILYMRIAADGATTPPASIAGTDNIYDPLAVASDGARFMIGWYDEGEFGIRISATDLTVLDSKPLAIFAGPFSSGHSPSSLTVAGNSTPAADQRTFLAGYKMPDGVTSRRIRSATGNLLSATNIPAKVTSEGLFLASDGTDFLAVWADSSNNDTVLASRIGSLDGAAVGTPLDVFGPLDTSLYGSPFPRVALATTDT
jgi:hypothetical protein